jgi:hydroxymethylbilane synthase
MAPPHLRIGTRGSPLALAQSEETRRRLAAADPSLDPARDIEIVVIRTTGDVILDRTLADVGGKGLFTKEIDEALLASEIDLAVHSAKDLPTLLPDGICLAAVLPREDVRDVLIATAARGLGDLALGAVVGSASLRRQAQLLARRPDLRVIPLRGNVHTRISKVERGEVAATLLALAGLRRLGLTQGTATINGAFHVLSVEEMLPAVGQGAIAVACRRNDEAMRARLMALNDEASAQAVAAERAMLTVLDGSCRTPIGGYAEVDVAAGRLSLRGLIARPDGSQVLTTSRSGLPADAERLGSDAGEELRQRGGPGFFG